MYSTEMRIPVYHSATSLLTRYGSLRRDAALRMPHPADRVEAHLFRVGVRVRVGVRGGAGAGQAA